MDTRHKWLFSAALGISLAAALPVYAQDGPPAPEPQSNGGWRKFGGPQDQPQQQPADAPQQQYAPQYAPSQLTLPAGTWITVRMNELLSSDHNQLGDPFTATLVEPLVANGLVVAYRGQAVHGRVEEVDKGGRVKGTSRLGVQIIEISVADGQQVPVQTQMIQRRASTSVGRDAAAIGTTTGVGAAIGAVAAGGTGAGIGAGAGAVASVIGVLVTKGYPAVLYPEQPVTFQLIAPVTISTERSAQAFQPVRPDDYQQQPGFSQRPGPPPRLAQGPPPAPYYAGYPYPYYPPYYAPYYGYGYGFGPSLFFYSGPRFYGYRGGFYYHRR